MRTLLVEQYSTITAYVSEYYHSSKQAYLESVADWRPRCSAFTAFTFSTRAARKENRAKGVVFTEIVGISRTGWYNTTGGASAS